ncbi:hypothetical protein CBR_g67857 [Chara braunii]|uniref:Amino acid transporter transmembrane domain-containing protein n=1 Tax=Chara braunii TaxID=69332 RepID=A0A388MFX6_CHABU|nr:hypothetical protein CBR_g67857 [Chara braunii]|eukprot:GBG93389.1 hypothetical protein CBR_g67857 [Chara braunii]
MAENERRGSREPATEEQVPLVSDRAGVGGASTCGQDTCLDAQLSSRGKTFFNIFISLMGAGILGLPHAFKQSGWIAGIVAIIVVAGLCYYCMILLVPLLCLAICATRCAS